MATKDANLKMKSSLLHLNLCRKIQIITHFETRKEIQNQKSKIKNMKLLAVGYWLLEPPLGALQKTTK